MTIKRLFLLGTLVLLTCPGASADSDPLDGTVNFETPHVSPLEITPDGRFLLAINTPAHTLEVFSLEGASIENPHPIRMASIPVGLDPVSVRAFAEDIVWVVNHVSDSISVVDLNQRAVVATLRTANEPADVVFAGTPKRAFVTASEANLVQVFDPNDLAQAPIDIPIQGEDPRAMAVSLDGSQVYVGVFESGNATTSVAGGGSVLADNVVSRPEGPYGGLNPPPNDGNSFNPPINPGITVPPTAMIVRKDDQGRWMDDNNGDWSVFVSGSLAPLTERVVGWDLLDHDVATIDAGSLNVSYRSGLMNLVMHLAVHPQSGTVAAIGTEALNEVRFEPNLNGTFLRSQWARFGASGPPNIQDLNPHLNYGSPTVDQGLRDQSIADPRGIAWHPDGTKVFLTGMGSNNVVALGDTGIRLGTFDVGEGPTGIILDPTRPLGFVLNKFEASISVFDSASLEEVSRIAFYDPTPTVIKVGRPLLYDAHRTSGLGHVSCASCHTDARTDRLAWDLGDPSGDMDIVPNNRLVSPMKGPMLTQTLQDIMRHSRLHWRGDREDLAAFAPAYQSLMGDDESPSNSEMDAFGEFLDTVHMPPNPYRNLDGSRPDTITLPNGQSYFTNDFLGLRGSNNRGNNCLSCHLNGGTRNNRADRELSQAFFSPGLVPFYERLGYWGELAQGSTSGFGFFHDGADTIEGAARVTTAEANGKFVAELMTLEGPSGPLQNGEIRKDAHAAVGQQVTLLNPQDQDSRDELNQLVSIAESSSHVSLIAKRTESGQEKGYVYLENGMFQADLQGQQISLGDLIDQATSQNPITWTAVIPGTHNRLGIDRDLDGVLDGNDRPLLIAPEDQSWTEGSRVLLGLNHSDLGGGELGFSAIGLPQGLEITPLGTIEGSLSLQSAGIYSIDVFLDDGVHVTQVGFTAEVIPQPYTTLYFSFQSGQAFSDAGSIWDEDIVALDVATGAFSKFFDGSDVGVREDVRGFHILSNGDLLFSFNQPVSIPGLQDGPDDENVMPQDIVRFQPTRLGTTTRGDFFFHFDGSDIGLGDSNSAKLDAITQTPDGRLVFSTRGTVNIDGAFYRDEDLIAFEGTLGQDTTGPVRRAFDGSDVGMGEINEDIDGAFIDPEGELLLTTYVDLDVEGVSGKSFDLFHFVGTLGWQSDGEFEQLLDGRLFRFEQNNISALHAER